jgi:hypothetical protein
MKEQLERLNIESFLVGCVATIIEVFFRNTAKVTLSS